MKLLLHARRGHSQLDHTRLGAPLARGAETPKVVRAQCHMHSQQTALLQRKSRGPVRTAFRNIIFFLANSAFLQANYHPSTSIGATGTYT